METSTRRVEPEEALSHVGRVLERVLTGYHRAKLHGGADRVTTSELDGLLAATTERAFRRADRLPPDAEVLRILEDTRPELLGEGYHVVTLCEPAHRFVVKYAKSSVSIPPWPRARRGRIPGCGQQIAASGRMAASMKRSGSTFGPSSRTGS
jgi:hypothetical protein